MIICSSNVIADHEIGDLAVNVRTRPLNARLTYSCLGCTTQCGRCARTIQRILDKARAAAEPDVPVAGLSHQLPVSLADFK